MGSHAKVLLLCAAIVGSACAGRMAVGDDYDGAAQSKDTVVRAALEAQVFGFGGCSRLENFDSVESRWFPKLRLVRGTCEAEHGGMLSALVGTDADGVLFHLGTPQGLAFLLRLHAPAQNPLSDALDYAEGALRFMGELRAGEQVITTRDGLSADVSAALDSVGAVRLSRVVSAREKIAVLDIITASATRVRQHQVAVMHNGEATVTTRLLWERKNIH